MFDLKRPCKTCPFRKGQGELFGLGTERLNEIIEAVSFQCHSTVDYNSDDPTKRQGDKPQQCAGLMSLLSRENKPNQLMQVGERLGGFFPERLDHSIVYASLADAFQANGGVYDPNHEYKRHAKLAKRSSRVDSGSALGSHQPSLADVKRRRQGDHLPGSRNKEE